MSNLKAYYGDETRVFVTTHLLGDGYMGVVELQTPLRSSIDKYLYDCGDIFAPVHVFLNPKEEIIFSMALSEIARYSLHTDKDTFFKIYYNILSEQKLDLKTELRGASYKPDDDEAREHLRHINLRLREHLENFPIYYNAPVRLPSQKGALRKPKIIDPVKVSWPIEEYN